MSSDTAATTYTSSVVDHVVLLKVRSDATPEQVDKLIKGVQSLRDIPGVVQVSVGTTFYEDWMPTDRRRGVTHALSVRLESKEALRRYQDHTQHVQVLEECIKPILVEPAQAVDWETTV
jgi:hypothetical protein